MRHCSPEATPGERRPHLGLVSVVIETGLLTKSSAWPSFPVVVNLGFMCKSHQASFKYKLLPQNFLVP